MWEFDLELPIDKNFIKQVLVFIADVICLQDGLKHDTISQFDLTTPTLENMNLYFSYGSNMSIDQMKKRCPSASPVCLAELLNFQYFINKRGVASVVPRIGHSTKGVIWDLKSNKNFVKLDKSEGTKVGYYKRINVQVNIKGEAIPCKTYIANDTEKGSPRPFYQELVLSAVRYLRTKNQADVYRQCMHIKRTNQDSEDEYELFEGKNIDQFNLWEKELQSWVEQ